MELKLKAVFVVSVLCFSCTLACQCGGGPPNTWCHHDLTAFDNCLPSGECVTVKCKPQTRCSCYWDTPCSGNNASTICLEYTQAPDMVKTFVLSYHGYYTVESPAGVRTINIEALVRQDVGKSKYIKNQWQGTLLNFEVVVPNKDGKFDKYTGIHPSTCTKTELSTFPLFGEEITHFTLKNTTDDVQTWYFQIGPADTWSGYVTRTYTTSPFTDQLKPLTYTDIASGSVMSVTSSKLFWKTGYFDPVPSDDDDFTIPSFCQT